MSGQLWGLLTGFRHVPGLCPCLYWRLAMPRLRTSTGACLGQSAVVLTVFHVPAQDGQGMYGVSAKLWKLHQLIHHNMVAGDVWFLSPSADLQGFHQHLRMYRWTWKIEQFSRYGWNTKDPSPGKLCRVIHTLLLRCIWDLFPVQIKHV